MFFCHVSLSSHSPAKCEKTRTISQKRFYLILCKSGQGRMVFSAGRKCISPLLYCNKCWAAIVQGSRSNYSLFKMKLEMKKKQLFSNNSNDVVKHRPCSDRKVKHTTHLLSSDRSAICVLFSTFSVLWFTFLTSSDLMVFVIPIRPRGKCIAELWNSWWNLHYLSDTQR